MIDQHLHVFVTVVEHASFSRAAHVLHMTQPAVSQYIKTLEQNLNIKLLERNNKMVRLTKGGEVVYRTAKEILALYSRMQRLIDDMLQKPSGKLTIGASYSFGEYVLPHVIARLREAYPEIVPVISIANTQTIADEVANHHLDIGIVEGDVHHARLQVQPFADDSVVIVVSATHPLADKEVLQPSDLENETWIIREVGSGTREVAERIFEKLGISPQSMMEFGSTQIIKEAVEAGLGIASLSSWVIRKELDMGIMKTLNVSEGPFKRKFSLVSHAAHFQTKAMDVFVDTLYQVTNSLQKSERG